MDSVQFQKLLEKHKLILDNPFWVFDDNKSYTDKITQHYKFDSSGLKYIGDSGILGTLWSSVGTSLTMTAILYAYKGLVKYADKEVSKNIVRQYLIYALVISDDEERLLNAINILSFDLTAKSILRYNQIAENRLDNPTTFDVIKGLYKQLKNDGKINIYKCDTSDYIEKRKSDYILPRLNARSIAFTANLLFIFNQIDNREYKELINKYTFDSISEIKYTKSPDNHDIQCQIYDLIESYEDQKRFDNYFNDRYKLFKDLIND